MERWMEVGDAVDGGKWKDSVREGKEAVRRGEEGGMRQLVGWKEDIWVVERLI